MLRVVPGTIAHTKEATGATRLNERRGPVDLTSTGPLRRRRSAFPRKLSGDCNLRVRAAIQLELCHDNVNQKVFEQAQPLWLGNGNSRNTARAGGPHQGQGFADRAVVQPERKTSVRNLRRARFGCQPRTW